MLQKTFIEIEVIEMRGKGKQEKFQVSLVHFNVIFFSLSGYWTNSLEYKITDSTVTEDT